MRYLLLLSLILATLSTKAQTGYRLFRTAGALPFMEYGQGDDRLGGAKMGYLDSNILIRVVDSVNGDYKVQLSRQRFAYMPKNVLKPAVQASLRPYYLSSSFKVFGDSLYDYVSVNMEERLPYRSSQTIHPNGLDVDIFGVTSNTNWITQLSSATEIANTWYEQVEDDVLRIHITLKDKYIWGHSISYDSLGRKMVIRVKRPPPPDFRKWRIAIDAGHGGTNSGAAGVKHQGLEKDYTLMIAGELEKAFRREGVKNIVMTRTKDTTLSMEERILMLRQEAPDILISVHLNSSSLDSIRGTSTYYRYIGFRPLSQAILHRMLGLGLKEYGNVGAFNFALSGPTEYPNCLVEVAFLSNAEDERKIMDPVFRRNVAGRIVEGVKDFSRRPQ